MGSLNVYKFWLSKWEGWLEEFSKFLSVSENPFSFETFACKNRENCETFIGESFAPWKGLKLCPYGIGMN
jgi:hypothetical protein